MSKKPQGPFTLWVDDGAQGWSFQDFATLIEALEADKFSGNWHISKPAVYVVEERPRASLEAGAVATPPIV